MFFKWHGNMIDKNFCCSEIHAPPKNAGQKLGPSVDGYEKTEVKGYAAANLLGDVLLVHTIKVHLPPQRPPNTAEALAKPRRIRE